MAINVVYEGLVLVEGAQPKQLPEGLFVPMESPMPVGTELFLVDAAAGGSRRAGRVFRVSETGEAGILVAVEAPAVVEAPVVAAPAKAEAAPEAPAQKTPSGRSKREDKAAAPVADKPTEDSGAVAAPVLTDRTEPMTAPVTGQASDENGAAASEPRNTGEHAIIDGPNGDADPGRRQKSRPKKGRRR